ncbi:14-3-3 protein [Geosmithia morbida]|uniref:14-3-3 protein n=1 Tax=Geosmithia morbida TaxID=1094350 RepID=A0A9P4YNE9_9HYPO|nr:14-3-3 protein [Geosmithia morbida]KAF4120156.1 14-3-3 protein [Geosmithia morbida]
MASSEVDQKFLGRLAKAVEKENGLLSNMLFKILGLSLSLAEQLVAARKERRPNNELSSSALRRILHILWLSREGLVMLHQYVVPMVGNYVELKVLAYKLRASFHHIFVLFYNNPSVSNMANLTPEIMASSTPPKSSDDRDVPSRSSSIQPTHPMEGGPVGPPPGFEIDVSTLSPSALLPWQDYLPMAHQHFREAVELADQLLWGSHSLRLSVKTEYAAFLYECVHDVEASRRLAKTSIAEAYDAEEGMSDDMFRDTCELVTVLGKMMKRGLGGPKGNSQSKVQVQPSPHSYYTRTTAPPPGMDNAI